MVERLGTVVADLGGILREDKLPLPKEVEGWLRRFVDKGGELICITGAPLSHIPTSLFEIAKVIFAEMGAVRWERGKTTLYGASEIEELRSLLNIKEESGPAKIKGIGEVIIEGPREASLTLLFGSPPHYPGIVTDGDFCRAKVFIEYLLKEHDLALHIIPGQGKGYAWIDIAPMTKEKTLFNFLISRNPHGRCFYLGDEESDIAPMKLPRVIPVGFPNCHPEIQKLARIRGIFINVPAPKGVVEFLKLLVGEE